MTSSDVGSFFTNIPLDETINNCVEDLLGSNTYNGKLSQNDLCLYLWLTKDLATSEGSFILKTNSTYKLTVLQWD